MRNCQWPCLWLWSLLWVALLSLLILLSLTVEVKFGYICPIWMMKYTHGKKNSWIADVFVCSLCLFFPLLSVLVLLFVYRGERNRDWTEHFFWIFCMENIHAIVLSQCWDGVFWRRYIFCVPKMESYFFSHVDFSITWVMIWSQQKWYVLCFQRVSRRRPPCPLTPSPSCFSLSTDRLVVWLENGCYFLIWTL